jgi:hypothetical protein
MKALENELKLNEIEFDRVINKALSYERCVYTKKLGNLLSLYYIRLGSRNVIREYLQFYEIIYPLPTAKTISKFIRKYLEEEKNLNFYEWKKQYSFDNLAVDDSTGKITYFPNVLRSLLIKEIFDINYYQSIDDISVILNMILFETDNLYLNYIFENGKYHEAYILYLNELIALVIVLINMKLKDKMKSDLFIRQNYKISFSTSTISYIKREVKNLF